MAHSVNQQYIECNINPVSYHIGNQNTTRIAYPNQNAMQDNCSGPEKPRLPILKRHGQRSSMP